MPSTFNILSASNELTVFNDLSKKVASANIVYDWTTVGGTGTLTVVEDVYRDINHYSFKVTPSLGAATPVVLRLSNVAVDGSSSKNNALIFHSQIQSPNELSVYTQLKQSDPLAAIVVGKITSTRADTFTVCRSNNYTCPDTDLSVDFDIEITISNHGGSAFYITQLMFVDDDKFYLNPFVRSARKFIPAIYWDKDVEQDSPSSPMFKLIDVLSWSAGDSSQLYSNFFDYTVGELSPLDELDIDPSWQESSLVSANYHDPAYGKWLFQFIGSSVKNNITSTATGSVNGYWFSDAEDIDAYIKWQLSSGYYGYAAGSNIAMITAAKLVLSGNKYVDLSQTNDFELKLTTLISETPDDLDGSDSSPTLLDAVMPAKPMGFTLLHEAVSSIILTLNSPSLGQLDEEPLG